MTDIYDEMYHLRNQRDAATRRAEKAEAENAGLRAALDMIAADCVRVPDSERNKTVRWVARIARAALDAEEDER